MRFDADQKDTKGAALPAVLIVTEAEAQEMCDDPRCDKAMLNRALLRCQFMEGWEVRGGADTLRRARLDDWAERAEAEVARASAPPETEKTPSETKEAAPTSSDAVPTPARPNVPATPHAVYSEAIAKLRAVQGPLAQDYTATPRQLMIEALEPVQQFGDALREAGVIKWIGHRSDIGWPNCAFETVGPGVNYEGYPVVFVYCVEARSRGKNGKISWQMRVWSEALNKRSRNFTDRDGYEKLFRFVTDCLERI